jgi:hypothetical protein
MTLATQKQELSSVWNNFQHLEEELKKFYTLRSKAFDTVADHYKEGLKHEAKWMIELINQIPKNELLHEFEGENALFKNFVYTMKNKKKGFIINFMLFPERTALGEHFKFQNRKIPVVVKKMITRFGKKFNRLIEVEDFEGWLAFKVGPVKN